MKHSPHTLWLFAGLCLAWHLMSCASPSYEQEAHKKDLRVRVHKNHGSKKIADPAPTKSKSQGKATGIKVAADEGDTSVKDVPAEEAAPAMAPAQPAPPTPERLNIEDAKPTDIATDQRRGAKLEKMQDDMAGAGKEPQVAEERPRVSLDRAEITAKSTEEIFEGDVYEESPRSQIEDLVSSIEDDLDSYREDFGVEGGAQTDTPSCAQVCDLQEAICTSSEKICGISARYPQEPWFIDRCDWSGKECKDASEQCHTCQD